jgi:putative Holliday junction resolvase
VARIVGLDVGERRIGLALSDASQTLARPVGVVAVRGLGAAAAAAVVEAIARHVEHDEMIDGIVVGLPRHLDGSASALTPRVESFAAMLRQKTGHAVHLQDERLTSREAESRLAIREKDWRVRKARLDAAAAAIILQDYLDSLPGKSMIGSDPDLDTDY